MIADAEHRGLITPGKVMGRRWDFCVSMVYVQQLNLILMA